MNANHKLFVAEYVRTVPHNAAKAAIAVGYSAKTAKSAGPRLLKQPDIAKAVDEALERQAKRLELKADVVLENVARIAAAAEDAADYGAALKGQELLGKNLKLWVERHEILDTTPRDPTPPLNNDERRELLRLQLDAERKLESLPSGLPVK